MDRECFKVFLGGLNETISEGKTIFNELDDLYNFLIRYGIITDLKVMTDKKGCKYSFYN